MQIAVPFAGYLIGFLLFAGCRTGGTDHAVTPPTAVDYFLLRAGTALDQEDPAEALRLARAALKADTTSSRAAFVVGEALLRLGRLEAAAGAFQAVVAGDPRFPDAWLKLGNVAYRKGQYERAVRLFQREVQTHASVDGWYNLGRAWQASGRADSAVSAYRRALQIAPTHAPALRGLSDAAELQGDEAAALGYAEQAMRANPDNREYQKRVGLLLLRTGAPAAALERLEDVVAQSPMDAEAQYAVGQAYQRLGESEAAALSFKRHRKAKAVQDAAESLRRHLRERPEESDALRRLARLLITAGEREEATKLYARLLYVQPDDHDARVEMATVLVSLGKSDAAERHYRTVLDAQPERARVWMYLGLLLARSGRDAEGAEAIARAVQLDPALRPRADTLRYAG